MSKKRSNIDISADILKIAMEGARKSHIVYQANLNFAIINEYLTGLIQSGLLDGPNEMSRLYVTTDKGLNFLNYYDEFKQFYA